MPRSLAGKIVFLCIVVGALLVIGRNVHKRNLNNALSVAIANNDAAAARTALANGADAGAKVGSTAEYAQPALLTAIQNGNAEITRLLLDKGADPRQIQQSSESLTHAALTFNDCPELINLLLARGLITAGNKDRTLLEIALSGNKQNTVRMLLARGSTPSYTDAAGYADANLRAILLSKATGDVSPHGKDHIALNDAANMGYADAVRFLLDRGANVNNVDQFQQTPLLRASGAGHADIVKMLLAKGADVAYKNKNGETALRLAQKYHHPALAALLKQAGEKE